MNENINLEEILKDCPEGTKLYTPLTGVVRFKHIDKNNVYSIVASLTGDLDNTAIRFTKEGKYYPNMGECTIFPSKEQRDWSKFVINKPKFNPQTLQPFDKVLVRYYTGKKWEAGLFSHPLVQRGEQGFVVNSNFHIYVVPYNDDTKHLVGTSDDAPEFYRYWEE